MKVLDEIIDYANDGWGEDRFFISNTMVGVIDAASPIERKEIVGYHSQAEWLADQMGQFMMASESDAEYPLLCRKFVDCCMKEVLCRYQFGIDNMPSATTAAIQERENYIDGYVIGDCVIDVLMTDESVISYTDCRVEPFSKKTLEQKILAIQRGENEQVAIKQQMYENRKKMNEADGYWVVTAKNDFEHEFISFSLPKEKVKTILIYSDGFGRIFEGTDITKEDVLMHYVTLQNCVVRQRTAENDINYVKKADDMSAVLLAF